MKEALSVWWLIMWRGTLGGAAFGLLAGFVLAALGASDQIIAPAGYIIGVAWGIYCVKMALDKQYRSFRLEIAR